MATLIGLVGRRGAGKDLVAGYLVRTHGFRHVKFATALKQALHHLFQWDESHTDGPKKETVDPRWGVSPRQMMQFFGTEVLQHKLGEAIPGLGRTHAVRRLFLDWAEPTTERLVISDCRFQHEVDEIKRRDGLIVKLIRDRDEDDRDAVLDAHESEANVDTLTGVDVVIENDGDVEDLFDEVENHI